MELAWSLIIGVALSVTIISIALQWFHRPPDQVFDDEEEELKLKTDLSKQFAQNVKFIMRLKRRMKTFKERKKNKID